MLFAYTIKLELTDMPTLMPQGDRDKHVPGIGCEKVSKCVCTSQ